MNFGDSRPRHRAANAGLVLLLLVGSVVWAPVERSAAASPDPFGGGDGTCDSNPYLITERAHLVELRDKVNGGERFDGKCFLQTADIDLIGITNWEPIGNRASGTSEGKRFSGTYDGGEHTIRNLRSVHPDRENVGLFGVVDAGEVKNLRLEGVDVHGKERVGGLIGRLEGARDGGVSSARVENVSVVTGPPVDGVERSVRAEEELVGGIVGQGSNADLTGQIVFVGTVVGGLVSDADGTSQGIGGIIGRTSGTTALSVAYVRGEVRGNNAGGLAGSSSGGASTFANMYAAVTIGTSKDGQDVGGAVIGRVDASGDVINDSVYWDETLHPDAYGPTNPDHGTRNAVGLATSDMQGTNASTAMGNLQNGAETGPQDSGAIWRIVALPTPDYPVFAWQRGDRITLSGSVRADSVGVEGVQVLARSGDNLFADVSTDTDADGDFSFEVYATPTERLTAEATLAGVFRSAVVESSFTGTTADIELNLVAQALTVSTAANNNLGGDAQTPTAAGVDANLQASVLRDRLLAGDVTIRSGADVTFEAWEKPVLAAGQHRQLRIEAGGDVNLDGVTLESDGDGTLTIVLAADGDVSDLISFTPTGGTSAGGMSITFTVPAFNADGTQTPDDVVAKVDGENATVHRVKDQDIIASVPVDARTGAVDVEVTADGLPTLIVEDGFTYLSGAVGDFRVQNFATGTGNGNFVLRGYVFRPSRDVTVTGMWGGSGSNCTGFEAFITDAEVNEADLEANADVPGIKPGSILSRTVDGVTHQARVDWRVLTNDTPEYQDFTAPFTLSADQYYFIGQRRDGTGSGCHFNTSSLDFTNLLLGSAIIDEWYPRANSQYVPSSIDQTIFTASTDSIRILVGFRYDTDTALAVIDDATTSAVRQSDSSVLLASELTSSGVIEADGETTLYFEVATNDTFTGGQLLPATPPDLRGPGTGIPFARSVTGLNSSTTYYYRPIAINEAGRVDGAEKSFRISDMDAGLDVTTVVQTLGSGAGSVTPALRTVLPGDSTTFVASPTAGSAVTASATSGCGSVTAAGNTFTVGAVTAACTVTFTFGTAPPTPLTPPSTPPVVVPPPLPPGPVLTAGTAPRPSPTPTARMGDRAVTVVPTPAGTTRTEGSTTVSTATILEVEQIAVALDVTGAGEVRTNTGAPPEVRVVRDSVARTSGSGMLPDTQVQAWLPLAGGDARPVMTLPVAADGTFTGELPFDGRADRETDGRPLPIGTHVLQLVGVNASGDLTVIEQTIRIEQPAPSPEPDRNAGAPPTLTPGASIATNAGLPETVTVVPLPEVRQARVEGSGWTMAVDMPSADGRVAPSEDGGALIELVAEDVAQVSGNGFLPGTRADVWLFSTPTLLGTVTIGPDGSFSGDVPVTGITVGEHTLQLQGVGTDGYVRAANLGVAVVTRTGEEPVVDDPEPDVTPPPAPEPDAPDDTVTIVTAADQPSGINPLVVFAVLLGLAAGLWWFVAGRRRREDEADAR